MSFAVAPRSSVTFMNLDSANIPVFEPKNIALPDAAFVSYKMDFGRLKRIWQEFGVFENILVIGHGGSVSSFIGMCGSLGTSKNIFILSTTDPEYIFDLKKKLAKHQTLVIAISKSGETVTQVEALMHFIDYPLLVIAGKDSALEHIAKKINAKTIIHPEVNGRFSAFTEVGMIPAAISGLDVESMYSGAEKMYRQYKEDNIAIKAAQIFYALERDGFVDVFMPFYSHNLYSFAGLIVQLCHESFAKDGKGQTYLAAEAPESQHHTNQRFFGGRKNIAGFFVNVEHFREDLETTAPIALHSIHIRDGSLFDLHKIALSLSFNAEFKGTWQSAKIESIPIVALNLNIIDPQEIGSFIAFWQMYAVYSSVLRDVNPFDQPAIESAKQISWNQRKNLRA